MFEQRILDVVSGYEVEPYHAFHFVGCTRISFAEKLAFALPFCLCSR
jgi:hypothetical protein